MIRLPIRKFLLRLLNLLLSSVDLIIVLLFLLTNYERHLFQAHILRQLVKESLTTNWGDTMCRHVYQGSRERSDTFHVSAGQACWLSLCRIWSFGACFEAFCVVLFVTLPCVEIVAIRSSVFELDKDTRLELELL